MLVLDTENRWTFTIHIPRFDKQDQLLLPQPNHLNNHTVHATLKVSSANAAIMNNFGVIELASARTTSAPGWAYVPDTAIAPGSAGIQPANRKRARNQPGGGPSLSDLTARQEAKIRKEVEVLEKDGSKDNTIPLPAKSGRSTTSYTFFPPNSLATRYTILTA